MKKMKRKVNLEAQMKNKIMFVLHTYTNNLKSKEVKLRYTICKMWALNCTRALLII